MWMRDAEATEPQPTYATASLSLGVIVAVIGIIAVGIVPNIFTDLAKALVLTVAP